MHEWRNRRTKKRTNGQINEPMGIGTNGPMGIV
jgi:hypothetical protein